MSPTTVTCPREDCGGEVECTVILEHEGDAGVIGGLNSFYAVVECIEECPNGHELTDDEQEKILDTAVEKYFSDQESSAQYDAEIARMMDAD